MIFEVPFFKNSLQVTYTPAGIKEICFQKKSLKKTNYKNAKEKKIAEQIRKYLAGEGAFQVPVDWQNIKGTIFQKRVWKKMAKIPYGKVKTYGDLAGDLKSPGAARAVGTACGKNPVLLAIPCHRVVGRTGLGGFSGGGLPIKRQLLALEKVLH